MHALMNKGSYFMAAIPQLTITINDQPFRWICGNPFAGRAVYRGTGTYLRIGLSTFVEQEAATHRLLLSRGFPVAPLLQAGEYAGQPFFIEGALGDPTLGDIFEMETREHRGVSDASFDKLLAVVQRWADAQLRHAARDRTPTNLARTVRLIDLERLLPGLLPLTRQAFACAQNRLAVFPPVLSHGDFHPYNICRGGVIDLEMVHWSVAGYDVISGLLDEDLFPPDLVDYRYTPQQLAQALAVIDDLFHTYHLPLPSRYADDFLLCRMMRMIELAEHRPPAIQQWIYHQYETQATAYIASIGRNALSS
jgi:hypothetical protein